eukprot:gene10171-12034_t
MNAPKVRDVFGLISVATFGNHATHAIAFYLLEYTCIVLVHAVACMDMYRQHHRWCILRRGIVGDVTVYVSIVMNYERVVGDTKYEINIYPSGVNAAKGFSAAGISAGLRSSPGRPDLALVVSDTEATAAGCFTQNMVCAAPVTFCKQVLAEHDTVRAVLVNAGQANAATGEKGWEDSVRSAEVVAGALNLDPSAILLLSTGVIGQRIKMDEMIKSIPALVDGLGADHDSALNAATAITTTDLASKSAALKLTIGGKEVHIGGMTKGSGMIHPNMATMLGIITCDAVIAPDVWRNLLKTAVQKSFNQITVDGDTSTNDTVLGLANGAAGNACITSTDCVDAVALGDALTALCQALAKCIAWDGEGATCLLEVTVEGTSSNHEALSIAKSICGSHLTKAAVFGGDPNWGRIAAAAGYAGVEFDQRNLTILLGGTKLMEGGQPLDFDAKAASAYLKAAGKTHDTVNVQVCVGDGAGFGMAWGCDLSYDYVKINAEYHT